MLKAIVHNPYWDSLGGGERYVATVVHFLIQQGYAVDICWSENISEKILKRFGIDISACNFIAEFKSFNYDLAFWVCDGSLPMSLAKKTIIHYQVPFHGTPANTIINKIKANLYTGVCNSRFTKKFIDNAYSINSDVAYPPIDTDHIKPGPKENLIVNIARFSQLLHAKRQDVLIQAFAKLSGWKLVLAGGSQDADYVNQLRQLATNMPIEIMVNPSLSKIRELLGKAKIFWSATGFEINEEIYPEKVEHFGMSVVEAMAAGCVPIITNLGGHKEIIEHGKDGFLWDTTDQLLKYTRQLADDKLRKSMCTKALQKSKMFSIDRFYEKLEDLVGNRHSS